MNRFFSLILIVAFFIFITPPVEAKVLPQAKNNKTTVAKKTTTAGVGVIPRLRKDRKALNIYFSNTQNANAISYILVYTTNGKEEGAGGSVKPSEGTTTRELLFGTCSKNDCRYHTNISNMRLEVTIDQKSGKKIVKRYRIKV